MSNGSALICKICEYVDTDKLGIKTGDGQHEPMTCLRAKGAVGINNACRSMNLPNFSVHPGDYIHADCRRKFTNPNVIQKHQKANIISSNESGIKRSQRLSAPPRSLDHKCFFCDQEIRADPWTGGLVGGSAVKTHGKGSFASTISQVASDRADDWGLKISGKLEFYSNDLHAYDIEYHHICSSNFRTCRSVPHKYAGNDAGSAKRKKSCGRPSDCDSERAFTDVCKYFEDNDDEQLTIQQLHEKLTIYGGDYSSRYLKSRLTNHYGDDISILSSPGKDDIITRTENQGKILREVFDQSGKQTNAEKKRAILDAAVRLLRCDIKELVPTTGTTYPSSDEIDIDSTLKYLPDSLRYFFESLFVGKAADRKVASIGQAVIQAVRPVAVIAPLQLGLAVQVHHLTRSKTVVEILHAMGFASSYKEVLRYETNAASCNLDEIISERDELSAVNQPVLLLAADNVDHNSRTLDGRNTFHAMGMIAAFTPKHKSPITISRESTNNHLSIVERSQIPVVDHNVAGLARVKFGEILSSELSAPIAFSRVDKLWRLSVRFEEDTPNWAGMMSLYRKDETYPGTSSVHFLPMINLPPSDMTCINSCLIFLRNFARNQKLAPIITFDQPLFLKASHIIETSNDMNDIVLMLGSFHTAMNLLGSIGYVMEGSGLKEMLRCIYGENAIDLMMTGKSYSRAFRAHQLMDRALVHDLVENMNDSSVSELINSCECKFQLVKQKELPLADLDEDVNKLWTKIDTECRRLSSESKTSQLWIDYMRMMEVLRNLVGADRSGNWSQHLSAMKACLPIFAATGHSNYLKSVFLYVQKMESLAETHPDVDRMFRAGYHVVRRSDKFWSGLGSDLTIEQCLMRSLKCNTGLTRGSGMTDNVRAVWTLSLPICANMNLAMQNFVGIAITSSEQHKDLTESRVSRDGGDLKKLIMEVKAHTPFDTEIPHLRNIVTGNVAHPEVNVCSWESIGSGVVAQMTGMDAFSFKYSRSKKVKNLSTTMKIKTSNDRSISPALLFQRFLVVSGNGDLSYDEVMKFELCAFPPNLFETPTLLKKADKPPLAAAIRKNANVSESCQKPSTDVYVIDGGSLLRRVSWKNGEPWQNIADSYGAYVYRRYGKKAVVVFDGYNHCSVKDNTHERRMLGRKIQETSVSPTALFNGKQEEFLLLGPQKHELIRLIMRALTRRGIECFQDQGDADVQIAYTAVMRSMNAATSMIGEDTDLLVLAIHYSYMYRITPVSTSLTDWPKLYFFSEKGSTRTVYDIHEIAGTLGAICKYLPFVHALTGCDSTSRLHGVGKEKAFKMLMNRGSRLSALAEIFSTPSQTQETIIKAGEEAVCSLFGEEKGNDVNKMRCKLLSAKVKKAKQFVDPETLPPTSSATKYHSLRVYFQTMIFMGLVDGLSATDWGWKKQGVKLVPITMDEPPAPNTLLKIIHCNCTLDCKSMKCSCYRQGFDCTSACGVCQEGSCENSTLYEGDSDQE